MDAAIARHGRAEYDGDVEAVMATIGAAPVWEFHPLGVRVTGRDAVRAVYEVQLRHLVPRIASSRVRTVNHGPGTCTREAEYEVRLPDGSTAWGQGITVYEFDPDGLMTAERIYGSGALVPLVERCFPPEVLRVPGVAVLR
jgi:hypothetical protein